MMNKPYELLQLLLIMVDIFDGTNAIHSNANLQQIDFHVYSITSKWLIYCNFLTSG